MPVSLRLQFLLELEAMRKNLYITWQVPLLKLLPARWTPQRPLTFALPKGPKYLYGTKYGFCSSNFPYGLGKYSPYGYLGPFGTRMASPHPLDPTVSCRSCETADWAVTNLITATGNDTSEMVRLSRLEGSSIYPHSAKRARISSSFHVRKLPSDILLLSSEVGNFSKLDLYSPGGNPLKPLEFPARILLAPPTSRHFENHAAKNAGSSSPKLSNTP